MELGEKKKKDLYPALGVAFGIVGVKCAGVGVRSVMRYCDEGSKRRILSRD